MRILIVDDYPGNAEAARVLLELLGHECRSVLTGAEAIAVASAFDPHVILLDLSLPDISGYDVARAVRAREAGRRVYIAALSGRDAPDDRASSAAAGIDAHLSKPPRVDALQNLLRAAATTVADPDA